jgi:hypothetical protein
VHPGKPAVELLRDNARFEDVCELLWDGPITPPRSLWVRHPRVPGTRDAARSPLQVIDFVEMGWGTRGPRSTRSADALGVWRHHVTHQERNHGYLPVSLRIS